MAWLLPELDDGEEPELKPPELELADDEPELADDEPEFVELEPDELEPVEPELVPEELDPEELDPDELEPERAEDEPVELDPVGADVLVLCVDPGRARASAPAVTTLAMVTAVVVERTLFRPRSRSAMARRIPSRSELLMYLILRSCARKSLHEPSR